MTELSDEANPSLRELLREGARLYNQGDFWEAHEAWEEAWLALKDRDEPETADLVQGLILATAAFENLSRGKPNGFATQGAKALYRLREHRGRASEIGLANADAFYEDLLDVYLEVQRLKLGEIGELERDVPGIAVDG